MKFAIVLVLAAVPVVSQAQNVMPAPQVGDYGIIRTSYGMEVLRVDKVYGGEANLVLTDRGGIAAAGEFQDLQAPAQAEASNKWIFRDIQVPSGDYPIPNRRHPQTREALRITKVIYRTADVNQTNPIAYEVADNGNSGHRIIQAGELRAPYDTIVPADQAVENIRSTKENLRLSIPPETIRVLGQEAYGKNANMQSRANLAGILNEYAKRPNMAIELEGFGHALSTVLTQKDNKVLNDWLAATKRLREAGTVSAERTTAKEIVGTARDASRAAR
jgi:hypothetical protein